MNGTGTASRFRYLSIHSEFFNFRLHSMAEASNFTLMIINVCKNRTEWPNENVLFSLLISMNIDSFCVEILKNQVFSSLLKWRWVVKFFPVWANRTTTNRGSEFFLIEWNFLRKLMFVESMCDKCLNIAVSLHVSC